MFFRRLFACVWSGVPSVLLFREAGRSTKRGRNQLRIATGLAAVAAAGYSIAKLIDPPLGSLDFWFWFYFASTVLAVRSAAWLFLTVEGGEE